MHRWGSMMACAAACAFALSLLDRDGDTPAVSDVLGDFSRIPLEVMGCLVDGLVSQLLLLLA